MKNIISLAFLLILSVAVRAQTNTTAEVFIELSDEGRYTITLDDQSITSTRSRIRFFDVERGNATLTIALGNQQLLNNTIHLTAGKRLIFSYSKRLGLKALGELDLYNNNRYALDNWNGYQQQRPNNIPSFPRRRLPRAMDQQQFDSFLRVIKNEAFDNSKHNVFVAAIKNNALTVDQLIQVLKLYNFDDGKLKTAFFAFDYITDPQRFFQVRDSFVFLSSKEKLDEFLSKK